MSKLRANFRPQQPRFSFGRVKILETIRSRCGVYRRCSVCRQFGSWACFHVRPCDSCDSCIDGASGATRWLFRLREDRCPSTPCRFQPTPPRGGRPSPPNAFAGRARFNPRPRRPRPSRMSWVSIHAPARGATCKLSSADYVIGVSIHAPARGATSQYRLCPHAQQVSIHAPARGATAAK